MADTENHGVSKGWPLSQRLTLVIIVTTWIAMVVSAGTAYVLQRNSDSSARQLERQTLAAASSALTKVGDSTALAYLTHLELVKSGLVAALNQRRELQPYAPVQELDVSVSDGVALLNTSIPHQTLADLGLLYGQLEVAYGNFEPGYNHALTAKDRIRLCRILGYVTRVERDFSALPDLREALLSVALPTCPSAAPA